MAELGSQLQGAIAKNQAGHDPSGLSRIDSKYLYLHADVWHVLLKYKLTAWREAEWSAYNMGSIGKW